MAMVIEHDGKQYLLTIDKPETDWITLIASALGMTKETVVGAAINRGLTAYVEMLAEISKSNGDEMPAGDETNNITSDVKDRKEYNKGPCQG